MMKTVVKRHRLVPFVPGAGAGVRPRTESTGSDAPEITARSQIFSLTFHIPFKYF